MLKRDGIMASVLLGFTSPSAGDVVLQRLGTPKVGRPQPVINGPSGFTVQQGTATPLSGITVTAAADGSETFVVSDTNGILTATGATVSGSGTNTVTITGSPSTVNAALQTLSDTDSVPTNDTLMLTDTDPVAGTATPKTIPVTVTACYARGTRIATPDGERAIESLAIGDLVQTQTAGAQPVRWIGYRAYEARFIRANRDILPIRIAAGALADGLPVRDLFVSPRHAMSIDGVLIEARDLVNGVSIVQQQDAGLVEYFHLELAQHEIVFAEGAPSESFVDDDSRMMFHNAHDYAALYPEAEATPGVFCQERVFQGARLQAIRARLAARTGCAAAA